MCFFGGSPKTPEYTPPPQPSPPPSPIEPSETAPLTQDERRAKLRNKLRGMPSTILAGRSRGLTGRGADLKSTGLLGKQTLGA